MLNIKSVFQKYQYITIFNIRLYHESETVLVKYEFGIHYHIGNLISFSNCDRSFRVIISLAYHIKHVSVVCCKITYFNEGT